MLTLFIKRCVAQEIVNLRRLPIFEGRNSSRF